jgi:hypothetical protein
MFAAFAELGVEAVPVVYSDSAVAAVRKQLFALDGVLVWVNPIEQGLDRSTLDPLLREVADARVWVSAHPDVILKLATKRVLVDTARMSWSAGAHLYGTFDQLRAELPDRLGDGAVVLKQYRGMGGDGVWKVETGQDGSVLVQHAAVGGDPERMRLEAFLGRCQPYFRHGGLMVEQPFQPRAAEGMIRVYLSHDEVVGFAHQYPRGLLPPSVAASLPTGKAFQVPSAPAYRDLRAQVEAWVRELQRIVDVDRASLPVIWDADFLYGPKAVAGDDTYVLCEINASSTFAFPEHAMPTVARAAIERIEERR